MDPDANLDEQRRLVRRIHAVQDATEGPTMGELRDVAHDAYRLAELVEALDQWIARGGFLPARWRQSSTG
jgi:hypothetical protein